MSTRAHLSARAYSRDYECLRTLRFCIKPNRIFLHFKSLIPQTLQPLSKQTKLTDRTNQVLLRFSYWVTVCLYHPDLTKFLLLHLKCLFMGHLFFSSHLQLQLWLELQVSHDEFLGMCCKSKKKERVMIIIHDKVCTREDFACNIWFCIIRVT